MPSNTDSSGIVLINKQIRSDNEPININNDQLVPQTDYDYDRINNITEVDYDKLDNSYHIDKVKGKYYLFKLNNDTAVKRLFNTTEEIEKMKQKIKKNKSGLSYMDRSTMKADQMNRLKDKVLFKYEPYKMDFNRMNSRLTDGFYSSFPDYTPYQISEQKYEPVFTFKLD